MVRSRLGMRSLPDAWRRAEELVPTAESSLERSRDDGLSAIADGWPCAGALECYDVVGALLVGVPWGSVLPFGSFTCETPWEQWADPGLAKLKHNHC